MKMRVVKVRMGVCGLLLAIACEGKTVVAEQTGTANDAAIFGDLAGGDADDATPDVPFNEGDTASPLDTALPDGASTDDTLNDTSLDAGPDGSTVDSGPQDIGPPDTGPDAHKPPDTFVAEDATEPEDVTPSFAYRWVRITDDVTNPSILICLKPTPGADIDAIESKRDGEHVAYAIEVVGEIDLPAPGKGKPCAGNTANDPDVALGEPDTDAVSLNAGKLTLKLEGEGMATGDTLTVYEAGLVDAGVPERYQVEIAQVAAGPWLLLGTFEGAKEIPVELP